MAKGPGGTGKGASVGGRVSKVAAGAAPAPASVSEASVLTAATGLADRNGRVALEDLRPKLGGTREQQDKAMLALMDSGKAVLMRNDYTKSITPAGHAAALIVGGNNPRHILMLRRG